jgi:hypothetical protein
MDAETVGCELVGEPYEMLTPKDVIDEFGEPAKHYYDQIIIAQNIKVTGENPTFSGSIFTNACTSGTCRAEYFDFKVEVKPEATISASEEPAGKGARKGFY